MDEGRNMAEIKLKKREEMDPAYCWDLSSLFGSDEEFEKTEQELAKKIEAFRAKQGTMKESAKALYDVLSGLDDISRVFSSLYVYASQKYHQDMGNQKYQGYAGKMDSMMAVLADASSFVEPEILELDEETVTEFEKAYAPIDATFPVIATLSRLLQFSNILIAILALLSYRTFFSAVQLSNAQLSISFTAAGIVISSISL